MKKVVVMACCALMFASCTKTNQEAENKLKNENDSLLIELNKRSVEVEETVGLLNSIEENFKEIKDLEKYVDLQKNASGEMTTTAKERIGENIKLISKIIENNKAQISKLQSQLNSSKNQSAELQKTITRLTAELESKSQLIESLQAELAQKNIKIQELDNAVTDLRKNVRNLAQDNSAQQEAIATQDKQLNEAWYVFGTKSELKEQRILDSGDLLKSQNANKEYFTKIDIRNFKEVKLYAKKADLLSTHPANSYVFEKDVNKELTLKITNVTSFWSVSKYLVIQVR